MVCKLGGAGSHRRARDMGFLSLRHDLWRAVVVIAEFL